MPLSGEATIRHMAERVAPADRLEQSGESWRYSMARDALIAAFLLAAAPLQANACTGISLATPKGEHIHGRTIERGQFDLNSKLIVSPRGHAYTAMLPDVKAGLGRESSLGFVGISVSDDRFIGEGVNDAGLNAGLFSLQGLRIAGGVRSERHGKQHHR